MVACSDPLLYFFASWGMMVDLVACHDCDLLHRRQVLPAGETARCTRCGCVLQRSPRNMIDRCLALSMSSLLLLLVSNLLPFLSFRIGGREQNSLLTTGVRVLYEDGYELLAGAVAVTGILAPTLMALCLVYLTLPLRLGRRPPGMALVCRWLSRLKPWSMVEVYLLGVIVSFVKLSDMADLVIGPGCLAFVMLIVTQTAAVSMFDIPQVWRLIEERPAGRVTA